MPTLSKFLIDFNLMSLTEQTKPFNYIKDVMSQIIEERKSKNIVTLKAKIICTILSFYKMW